MEKKLVINTCAVYCGTFKESLQKIKKAGFTSVMLCEKEAILKYSITLEEIIKAIHEEGLEIYTVHLKRCDTNRLWRGITEAQIFVDETIEKLKIMHKHNLKHACMHLATNAHNIKRASNGTPPPTKEALISFKQILDAAAKLDIMISVENLPCAKDGIEYLIYTLDNISHPNLGLCYDVGHDWVFSRDMRLLERYHGRVSCIHLHDNPCTLCVGEGVEYDPHMIPGDGIIPFKTVIKELVEAGYKGPLLMELKSTSKGIKKYKGMKPEKYLAKAHKMGTQLLKYIK